MAISFVVLTTDLRIRYLGDDLCEIATAPFDELRTSLGAGGGELMSVRFESGDATYEDDAPIIVQLDKKLTRINDGNICIHLENVLKVEFVADTGVCDWMIYR